MNKILSYKEVPSIVSNKQSQDNKIVLVGGVFDILHFGHVRFLEEAKKRGDILIVALEPDSKVKKTKGEGRPINTEMTRAEVLSALSCVDHIVTLPELTSDKDYEDMILNFRPDVVAVTEGDPQRDNKRKQIESVGGKLEIVTSKIPTLSSTQRLKLLSLE